MWVGKPAIFTVRLVHRSRAPSSAASTAWTAVSSPASSVSIRVRRTSKRCRRSGASRSSKLRVPGRGRPAWYASTWRRASSWFPAMWAAMWWADQPGQDVSPRGPTWLRVSSRWAVSGGRVIVVRVVTRDIYPSARGAIRRIVVGLAGHAVGVAVGVEPVEDGRVAHFEVEDREHRHEHRQPAVAGTGHDADPGGGEDGRRRRHPADHAVITPQDETGPDEPDAGHDPADGLGGRADRHGRDGRRRRTDEGEGPVAGRGAPQRPFEAHGVAEEEGQTDPAEEDDVLVAHRRYRMGAIEPVSGRRAVDRRSVRWAGAEDGEHRPKDRLRQLGQSLRPPAADAVPYQLLEPGGQDGEDLVGQRPQRRLLGPGRLVEVAPDAGEEDQHPVPALQ